MQIVPIGLGVALVIASGTALHLSRQVDSVRQQIAGHESRPAAQQQPGASIAADAPPAAVSDQAVLELAEEDVTAAQKDAAIAPQVAARIETTRQQSRSPEARARLAEVQRTMMASMNPDVGEAVGLNEGELEKLYDILADRLGLLDAPGDSEPGQATDAQQMMARFVESKARGDARLQELLGDRYARWMDYEQTRPVWQQRRDLRAVLNAAGTPMSQAQERALIEVLSVEQRALNQTPTGIFNQHTPERHARLLAAAGAVLSPEQMEGYRQMLARAAAHEQANARLSQPSIARPATP